MEQKDKELLLIDLCARLPYGVKVQCGDYLFTFDKDHMGIGMLYKDFNMNPLESPKIILSGCYYGEDIKPYLFPLSSMTEEQKRKYNSLRNFVPTYHYEYGDIVEDTELYDNWESIDYLIANHFDYRGLIEMGLAIDATGLNIY